MIGEYRTAIQTDGKVFVLRNYKGFYYPCHVCVAKYEEGLAEAREWIKRHTEGGER